MALVARGRKLAFLVVAGMTCGVASATDLPGRVAAATVPVVMLSDIHFDPFHDPAKFDRLRAAPVTMWQRILTEPDAPTQATDFAGLSSKCPARGVDTPWTLLESSVAAAHAQSPHPLFVTVSGDLVVHKFDCRFHALAHGGSEAEFSDFAAKTVAFVASELRRSFPRSPVYMALGNNDAGCGDYREGQNSAFLADVARTFSDATLVPAGRAAVASGFPLGGNYSVALPNPIVRGRLIVLQDVFLSREYAGCNGKADLAPGAAQLEWLRTELAAARTHHEQVWVMAHIPPGVNVYSTVQGKRNVCGGQAPVMFLSDERLVDVLTEFAAEIRLVLFGHTHMDEMRLLHGVDGATVAVKLLPAVTPINGNLPAFTLAEVEPRTAVLKDYRVVFGDNQTGIGAKWSEEYRYSTTYDRPAFRAEDVAAIVGAFRADQAAASAQTQAYENNFMVGGGLRAIAMRLLWPETSCAITNDTAAAYRGCVCPEKN